MTTQDGADIVIKIGDGQTPENFTLVGGLRVVQMALSNPLLSASNRATGAWRQLQDAGVRSLSIQASGIFTDSQAEELVRQHAFGGGLANYQFVFGNGDHFEGAFCVAGYERGGNQDNAETYQLALESAGQIDFTKD